MAIAGWNVKVLDRDEQRRQKRLAVLGAAAGLFTRQGYDRTSLDDIAQALNVTKRTLYYYVKSKEEILFECNRMAIEFMEPVMREAEDKARPPLERLSNLMRAYLELLSNEFGACLVMVEDYALSEESRTKLFLDRKKIDETVRGLIREGMEDGSIAPCDPKFATAALFGAFNWVPRWYDETDRSAWSRLADHLLGTMLDGLRPRP